MADNVDAVLSGYLRAHAGILYFMLDKNSKIIEVNTFTSKMIGRDIIGSFFQSIFVEFCDAGGSSGASGQDKRDGVVPLSVKMSDGLPRTFYFMFFDAGDARVALGDVNHDELDKMQEQFMILNSELGNMARELQKKNAALENALKKVRTLEGILPICSSCKKIRIEGSDPGHQVNWLRMEKYIEGKTDAHFSHSVCPACMEKLYPLSEQGH